MLRWDLLLSPRTIMNQRLHGKDVRDDTVVIGIDVGSLTRGFHAVALKEGRYFGKLRSSDARVLASWCKASSAEIIRIDAPCRWSVTGRARRAERELMAEGVWCFSTPSFNAFSPALLPQRWMRFYTCTRALNFFISKPRIEARTSFGQAVAGSRFLDARGRANKFGRARRGAHYCACGRL